MTSNRYLPSKSTTIASSRSASRIKFLSNKILIIVVISLFLLLHQIQIIKQFFFNDKGVSLGLHRGDHHVNLDGSCSSRCMNLDYDGDMDDILRDKRQFFITMPAKAAGTTLKQFTTKCMKHKVPDNFINYPASTKKFLTHSFRLPSIVASHLLEDKTMIDLVKHGNRQTLIIHIHREETDRLLSSIKHVATSELCEPSYPRVKFKNVNIKKFHINRNKTHCTFDEEPFVDLVESGFQEIGFGSSKILTCNAFKAIEQNTPNMVLVHYKQANKLQKLLTKHHCPELLDEDWYPTVAHMASEKRRDGNVYLRLKNGHIVQLDKWLHEKRDVIEYTLKMKHNVSCQGKMRYMEDDLFACKDEAMQITPKNVKCW